MAQPPEKVCGATGGTFRLVRLTPEHAQAVHRLETACFSLPWSHAQLAAALGQPHCLFLGLARGTGAPDATGLAYNATALAGYISCHCAAQELEILNLAVDAACRRRGLGRALLASALQMARKMAMEQAVLEVRESNIPAIRLYESLGFAPAGRRRRYYADTGEDALVYTQSLQPSGS